MATLEPVWAFVFSMCVHSKIIVHARSLDLEGAQLLILITVYVQSLANMDLCQ